MSRPLLVVGVIWGLVPILAPGACGGGDDAAEPAGGAAPLIVEVPATLTGVLDIAVVGEGSFSDPAAPTYLVSGLEPVD